LPSTPLILEGHHGLEIQPRRRNPDPHFAEGVADFLEKL
jgi:hypothetical protein